MWAPTFVSLRVKEILQVSLNRCTVIMPCNFQMRNKMNATSCSALYLSIGSTAAQEDTET
jgi:hypothetical protein